MITHSDLDGRKVMLSKTDFCIFLAVAIPRFDNGFAQDPVKKVERWMLNTTRLLRTDAVRSQKKQSGKLTTPGSNAYRQRN